jgi:methyltransferase (TIGR00027 family)
MLGKQASTSLERTAVRRAAHQVLDTPLIFQDRVAVGLVPDASEQSIRAAVAEHSSPVQTLIRAMFAVRSRFCEDRLMQAANRGVRQYVIVGAGLDTFPWRQPTFARGMEIFYLDHPASLVWTRARFRDRGLPIPSNLTFVGANLEKRDVAERLIDLGFNKEESAFFSMLGVTQYVGRDALTALFDFAVSLPNGSEMVFTFVPPDDELSGDDLAAIRAAVELHSKREPWITRLRALELADDLKRLGFSEIFHVTREHLHRLYFASRGDKLRAPAVEQLIAAIV